MKRLFHNKYQFLAVLVCFWTFSVQADSFEMTSDMYRSFKINENSKVEIENKYGDVFLETWDRDSVGFSIEIIAYSEKEDYLEDLIGMVHIDFNDYSSFIIAKTEIGESKGFLDKAAFKISKDITGTKEIIVNYRVFIPSYLSLSIENDFGDIFIDEYAGEISIDLSHGDLRANLLSDVKSIKSRYGEVKIEEAHGGRFDFGFVKGAELGTLSDVFIKSTSSEIDIEEMDVLRIESRLDEIYIESLGELEGKTTMSKIHVKYLSDSADLESKYGNIKVEDLLPTASKVKMNGNNTDYNINFSEESTGSFEIQMSKNKSFNSSSDKVSVKDEIALDDKTNILEGRLNGNGGEIKILMTTKNGDISLGM